MLPTLTTTILQREATFFMKEHVMLQFLSLDDLWAFKFEVDANFFEMNPRLRTIVCDCTKEEIDLAIKKFNAIVVDPQIKQD